MNTSKAIPLRQLVLTFGPVTVGFLLPVIGLLMLLGFYRLDNPAEADETVEIQQQYVRNMDRLESALIRLQTAIAEKDSPVRIQQHFRQARLDYKRIEYIAEYFQPVTVKAMNGPAIDEVEPEDPVQTIVEPTGFQVLEERMFPEYDPRNAEEATRQVKVIRACITRLRLMHQTNGCTPEQLFDAMRQEINRIITLGISGFDSPVAFHSVPEAAAAVQSLHEAFQVYRPRLQRKDAALDRHLDKRFTAAITYLNAHPDFDTFSRADFITGYANTLSSGLLDAQKALGITSPGYLRALSPEAPTMFTENAFQPDFFAPGKASRRTPERVELGKMLFFDPVLSGNNSRSCASCHHPEKAFTDGQTKSIAFNFAGQVNRNAPTIINAGLQRSLFHDMRVVFLEDQASDVLSNEAEMHGSLAAAVETLKVSPEYKTLFGRAFPEAAGEDAVNERHLKTAIASYVRSLTSFNSRFDQYMRGDSTKLTALEKTGFNVFMGKAKCATCHFMPLFNGTVPPNFEHTEAEIIGVPATTDTLHPELDPDPGKFGLFKKDLHRFAFKTPTVRNVELTAPYMHNGVYQTLEAVVEFYNKGGGQGLGLDLPTQTLPADPLNLTELEKQALVAFMRSLTDTSAVARSVPERLPAFPGKVALTGRKIGGEY